MLEKAYEESVMNKTPNPRDYKKFFTTHAEISCLHGEFLLKGSLGKATLLLTYKDGIFNIFLNKEKEKLCQNEGVNLFTNSDKYQLFIKGFQNYVDYARKHIIPQFSRIPETMTKKECKFYLARIGKFWYYYGVTEFPYIDLAYTILQKKHNTVLEKNLVDISTFKFTAREILNAYFFKKGVLDNFLGYLSKKFLKNDDAKYLYSDELLALFDGKKPDQNLIEQRRKCYGAMVLDSEIIKFSYETALEVNKRFTYVKETKVVMGKPANPGIARGRVVISPMLNDYEAIQKIDSSMKKGDILIAETTSPDILLLCKKASAIVAEQGGMLSHAAVVSRELGIPCVIQTEIATRIFKKGDLVEVDACKGTIRKITTT